MDAPRGGGSELGGWTRVFLTHRAAPSEPTAPGGRSRTEPGQSPARRAARGHRAACSSNGATPARSRACSLAHQSSGPAGDPDSRGAPQPRAHDETTQRAAAPGRANPADGAGKIEPPGPGSARGSGLRVSARPRSSRPPTALSCGRCFISSRESVMCSRGSLWYWLSAVSHRTRSGVHSTIVHSQ